MLKYICLLPEDLVNIIYNYIPIGNKYYLTKWMFCEYYRYKINKENNEKSIKKIIFDHLYIIKKDLSFLFTIYFDTTKDRFYKGNMLKKSIRYKNKKMKTVNDLFLFLFVQYKSQKCKTIFLNNFNKKKKLIYKNTSSNNNKWTN